MTWNLANRLLERLDKIAHFDEVYAHCDYPCGIYDPHTAQMAAHTVIRMMDLIKEMQSKKGGGDAEMLEYQHNLVRATSIKEQHAEICKHELRVLWGDYFKKEHADAYPKLNELVFNGLKLASKAKQTTDVKTAEELLSTVEQIAEIFWKTKGVETKRVTAFYPTKREIVYPKV